MKKLIAATAIATLLGASLPALAQTAPKAPAAAQTVVEPVASQVAIEALPADVASVDAIMAAVYDAISGPAGPRDWDRFRSLFHPEARLIPLRKKGPTVMSVENYIGSASTFFAKSPFFESELSRKTETYGGVVHAFSTYDSRKSPDEEPFARGINSFQLVYSDDRWWVMTILWQSETPDLPIPDSYLD